MEVGQTCAGYRLDGFLGAGGTAEVFAATGMSDGKRVVIKILLPDLPREYAARFLRECAILQELKHPGILRVIESGKFDGRPYYVMDDVGAVTLQARLDETYRKHSPQRAPATPEELMDTVMQVLDALEYAHSMGIFHRDIKPENVLLDNNGKAYLADFGLALLTDATSITAEGQMVGTISHMSPEQIRGTRPDARSDIYQVGLLLHEMFLGVLPYPELSTYQAMMKRTRLGIPDPCLLYPPLPAELGRVITKACSNEPSLRYSSVTELRAALSAVPPSFEIPVHAFVEDQDLEDLSGDDEATASSRSPGGFSPFPASDIEVPWWKRKSGRKLLFPAAFILLVLSAASVYIHYRSPDEVALAEQALSRGQRDTAERLLRLAVAEGAGLRARLALAKLLADGGRTDEAVQVLGERPDFDDPRVRRLYMKRASVLAGEKKWSKLTQLLGPALAATGDFTEAALVNAKALIRLKRTDEAAALLDSVRPKDQEQACRLACLRGELAILDGDADAALRSVERLAPATSSPAYGLPELLRAKAYRMKKRPEAEMRALEAAMKKKPDTGGLARLGELAASLGHPVEARKALAAVARRRPTHPTALPTLFYIASGTGRQALSVLVLCRLNKAAHPLATALHEYNTIHRLITTSSEDYTEGVLPRLRKLAEQNPLLVPARSMYATLLMRRDPKASFTRLSSLVNEYPCFAIAYGNLAAAARRLGLGEQVFGYYEKGMAMAPSCEDLAREYARALVESRKYDKAIEVLSRFVRNTPYAYPAYIQLGRYQMRYGNFNEAVGSYLNLCRLRPAPCKVEVDLGLDEKSRRRLLSACDMMKAREYRMCRAQAAGQLRQLRIPVPRPEPGGDGPGRRRDGRMKVRIGSGSNQARTTTPPED